MPASIPLGTSQPTMVRCPTCGGVGNITQSFNAPLPARVPLCHLETTGFLGMGSGRVATVRVQNDGDQPGAFSITLTGEYPGGGRIPHAHVDGVWIQPHAQAERRINFDATNGMQSVECNATAPTVVQQQTAICPTCHGQGVVVQR